MNLLTNNEFTTDTHYVKGLFLLILTVMGNFLGETIGCPTRKLLSGNMFVKQVVLICFIYFTISFTGSIGENPVYVMQKTIVLWMFFVMFTRMNIVFASIVFLLLAIAYIFETFISYHRTIKTEISTIQRYEQYRSWLILGIGGLTLIGFSMYLHKQIRDHKDFHIGTFIFGKQMCRL